MVLRLFASVVLIFLVVAAAKVIWPEGLSSHYQVGCLNEATPPGRHLFELYWQCSASSRAPSSVTSTTRNKTVKPPVFKPDNSNHRITPLPLNTTTVSTAPQPTTIPLPSPQLAPTPQPQPASVPSHPMVPSTPLPQCTTTPDNGDVVPY